MKVFLKILKWTFGILAALVLVLSLSAWLYLRTTLPDYDGELEAPALSAPVEVVRDSWGMPHIYAQTDWDAYFAQGYCEAQDRLFQMDMLRRVVRGRLSEILGERTVPLDKLFRTLTSVKTLEEHAGGLPREVVSALEAYAAGVNHFIEHHEGSLPVEFLLLGYEPEPWQPADCLAVRHSMAWGLNATMSMEIMYFAAIEKLGRDLAAEVFIDYPEGYPVTVPDGSGPDGDKLGLLRILRRAEVLPGLPSCGASNAWVLSAKKSRTGKPILANDMHLAYSSPAIWYEVHIQTPTHNVSGVTFAGMPLVVAGANQHVAWGFTNSMVDDSDYYIEKIRPGHADQYEFEGQWETMQIKKQVLLVKDVGEVPFRIRLTRHGPVVSDLGYSEPMPGAPVGVKWNRPGTVLSLRWTANEFFGEPTALYLLNRARNINEVEQAAVHFKVPGQNMVYADDQGNIGYTAVAGIPRREGFTGMLPLPGWDGKHEWSGYLAFDQQPRMRNPEAGWIATANNKMVDDSYPHILAHYFATPDRITRIRRMLNAKQQLGLDDMIEMHNDVYVVLAEELVPVIVGALDGESLDPLAQKVRALLAGWDFVADSGQPAAAVFHVFLDRLTDNIFRPRLGDDLFRQFVSGKLVYNVHNAIRTLVKKGKSTWFDDPETPEEEQLNDVVARSFDQALADLQARLGSDPQDWAWGKLASLTFFHPFGRFSKMLGIFFNVGPFPVGGSISTVSPSKYLHLKPWEIYAGASQRTIIDLSKMSNSLRVITTGISGNFMSSHYDDQVDLWLNGAYRPFVLDRESVERDRAYVLELTPAQ